MKNLSPDKIIYACLTHVDLICNFPSYVKTIHMGISQKVGQLNLKNLSPEWDLYHSIIGGTAGSFALKYLLLNSTEDYTHVGICQYRKFLTHKKIGLQAANYQVMDVVRNDKINLHDLENILLPLHSDFMVSKPGLFNINNTNYGYLYQYKDVHFVEDFLRFTAIAVEEGALDKNEVCNFFDEKIFIPGGIEMGVMPKEFWLKNISMLEIIVRRCINEYPYRREGSQARTWSFCCERLGSYFLLKEFRSKEIKQFDWIENNTGFLNLVVENDDGHYIPGT
jgi:hypothetical protein